MKIELKPGQSREDYVGQAVDYARDCYNELCSQPEYEYSHPSHAVARALEITEERFPDLGTFGVEGDCADNGEGCVDIQYLNAGDSYDLTVVYWRDEFLATSWGDCVEAEEN